jgi:hypothetical protein
MYSGILKYFLTRQESSRILGFEQMFKAWAFQQIFETPLEKDPASPRGEGARYGPRLASKKEDASAPRFSAFSTIRNDTNKEGVST